MRPISIVENETNACALCLYADQAACIQALACAAVVCGVLYGVHVEHGDHNGLLAAAHGAAGPFSGAKGSHRQHPCGSMLSFPLLLPVSAGLSDVPEAV